MKLDWHPLSNHEIKSVIDKNFGSKRTLFGGCYAKDELPKYQPKFYVFNLDNHMGPGTHWVMLNGAISSTITYYFDPFGAYPFQSVKRFVPSQLKIQYTDDFLQNMYSDMCGYYCIYMAFEELVMGRQVADIMMEDFSDNEDQNDKVVQALFKTFVL